MNRSIRVRFAPSPTGLLHLGSVRTALFNYLYAIQQQGTFILRIEDTDPERNFDPGAKMIIDDLQWLGLSYTEGPHTGGNYGPYFQSERSAIYQVALDQLIEKKQVYRCFCTEEELEKKRMRQMALKQPPRYDRTCTHLTQEQIAQKLSTSMPFVWRFKLSDAKTVCLNDLARGTITFDLSHFSDFSITRQNGSFTFLFANAVDDIQMKISHIFRGEDHISNTPCQVALYEAFDFSTPTFWHMPIICNIDGKKLSKRDFGFSLKDLREGGFLSEAICNYLGIIGASFSQEILSLSELAQAINFGAFNATSGIKYDLEKLLWVNHQWILRMSTEEVAHRAYPFLRAAYPSLESLERGIYLGLIALIKAEIKTLKDAVEHLKFYFNFAQQPSTDTINVTEIAHMIAKVTEQAPDIDACMMMFKAEAKNHAAGQGAFWQAVRYTLTGSQHGISIKDLINVVGLPAIRERARAYAQ